ncbi:hypothetical protein [Streptomyces sp. NPDC006971]|uniref:hypothetical protein n=1 Tax=Streptomyces sp. NPDC006971 TaxID=3154784 RepID=UPI0033F00E07
MLGEKVPGKKTSAPERKDAPERETASAREIVPMCGIAPERETASAHRTVPEQSYKAVGGPSAGATSQRIAHHLREAILNGEIAPDLGPHPPPQEPAVRRTGPAEPARRGAVVIDIDPPGMLDFR